MPKANPPWTREEVILAMDIYMRLGAEVIALSKLLRELPIHEDRPQPEKFRGPSSVYMKLGNLMALDPSIENAGLPAGSRTDKAVWAEFSDRPDDLQREAQAIRERYRLS